MYPKTLWQRRSRKTLVVAPASGNTWAVAFARRLIPGALFTTKAAAIAYAFVLATSAGLNFSSIKVLGSA